MGVLDPMCLRAGNNPISPALTPAEIRRRMCLALKKKKKKLFSPYVFSFFFELKPNANFQYRRTTPYRRKEREREQAGAELCQAQFKIKTN